MFLFKFQQIAPIVLVKLGQTSVQEKFITLFLINEYVKLFFPQHAKFDFIESK